MPKYDFSCTFCLFNYELFLSFKEFDNLKINDTEFAIECPNCTNGKSIIVFDECPHSHVVNTNNFGVYSERNTKKLGSRVQEAEIRKEQELAPTAKPGWYGRLPKDKFNEIHKSRKSPEEKKRIAKKYIMEGK